jgi:trimethylamine--corrinoid protein Co-methyltransferase
VAVEDGNRVRLPAKLVEWAIRTAPKHVQLYDRNGRPAIDVGGSRTCFGQGSDCLKIVDHRTNVRREPLLQDVRDAARLGDALENVDFIMSSFLPTDVDKTTADRYQMEAMLENTTKPIVFVAYDTPGCLDALEMAEAVAGGREALAERPFVACYINVATSLRQNQEALQKLLLLAERNLPSCYVPGSTAGAVSPVTVAGSNAWRFAGSLAGLTLAQLKREGAPVLMAGWAALALDLKTTTLPYTGPDHQGVTQALAHYLELPMFSLGGASDAKAVDQQAAAEAALTLLINAVMGGQLVHDLGYLESGMTGSLAQLAICDEIVAWCKRATGAVEIDDETLALDLVDQTGPDGQYLTSEHTLAHFREQWYPGLFERYNYPAWVARGSKTLAERAGERVDKLLAGHKPEPLPPGVAERVHAVVERAAATRAAGPA